MGERGRPNGTAKPPRYRPDRSEAPTEEDADLGNGETIPRCGACGVPSRAVLRGAWDGKAGMWFPVCASCIARWNGPQPGDADPKTIGLQ